MRLFLFFFFGIYGLMHLYGWFRLRRILSPFIATLLVPFFLAMIIAPVGIRLLEKFSYYAAATILAFIGYNWMGFLFLFCCWCLVTDLIILLLQAWNSRKYAVLMALVGAILTSSYGYYEASQIHIVHHIMHSPLLKAPVSITLLSDVHVGLLVGEKRVQKIVYLVEKTSPDLLLVSGDLVDSTLDHDGALREMFASLQVPLGKYAVTGNHEYYAGIEHSQDFIEGAGFTILHNESVMVRDDLRLAGVDDKMAQYFSADNKILALIKTHAYTILLKHRPQFEDTLPVDLQLSGHVHGGQIFPFGLLTRIVFPVPSGLSRQGNGYLYVSRGTGTWGPMMRLLAPPEITVIQLLPQP